MGNLTKINRIGRGRPAPSFPALNFPKSRGFASFSLATAATDQIPFAQADDLILAHVTITNGSDGATITGPGGEGWNLLDSVEDTTNSNSVSAIFWKRWGVAGNTDNSSPVFTASSGIPRVVVSLITSAKGGSGAPWSVTEHGTNHGASASPTAPSLTKDGSGRCVLRFFHGVTSALNFTATSETNRYGGTTFVLGRNGSSLVAGTAANALDVTSFAPGIPGGTAGSLYLLEVYMELASGANGDPSGWTLLHTTTHASGELHRLYGRIVTGSEGSTVTIPVNVGTGRQIGRVFNVPGQFRPVLTDNFTSITSTDFNSGVNPGGPTVSAAASTTLAFIGYDSGGTIAAISGGTGTWTKVATESVAGSAAGGIGIVTQIADAGSGLSGGTAALGNVGNSNVIKVVFNPSCAMACSELDNQSSGSTGTAFAGPSSSCTWTAITVIVDPTY